MTRGSIFASPGAHGPQWQLGVLPPVAGRFTLIGWSGPDAQIEGGVPEEVARVLSRAFVSVARVTFPCSFVGAVPPSDWSPWDGDVVRVLTVKGLVARIAAKLKGTPADITLISTRQPETAIRLFDDAAFPWWLQGQVVLLSAADAPPPDVGAETLVALFDVEWTMHAAPLARVGVEAIVRPGVDGDVAGLLALSDALERELLVALEREARREAIDWAVLPEEAFGLK